jgi:hypothetical protein
MRLLAFVCLAMMAVPALSQCVVWPGELVVPASYGCNGTWSHLVAPTLPTNLPPGQKEYIPPVGSYISFVITETDKLDIPANQTDVTLVITPPVNWEFRSDPAAAAYVYCDNSGDINLPMSSALVVTSTSITLTFSSNVNCNKYDWLFFCNIDARPTSGLMNPPGPVRYAVRTGGTGAMTGIVANSTVFARLEITPGSFTEGHLAFAVSPASGTVCDDLTSVLRTEDCAGNPTTVDLPASFPLTVGVLPVPGRTDFPKDFDIGTAYGNGEVSPGGYIRDPGSYRFVATPASSSYSAVSSDEFSLTVCPPSQLVWIVEPDQFQEESWRPLKPSPLVLELRDPYDNPSYVEGSVTLLLDKTLSSDPAALLRGTAVCDIAQNARVQYTDLGVTTWVDGGDLYALDPSITVGGVLVTKSRYFSFSAPMPVELVSFSAVARDGMVKLQWRTATESNNYGFEVERRATGEGWQRIGFVAGAGTSNAPRDYRFDDVSPGARLVSYRLHQIDRNGSSTYSTVINISTSDAASGAAVSVYPSSLTAEGTLLLSLNSREEVTIEVFDRLGRKAMVLARGTIFDAGNHAIPFSAAALSPGVYYLRCSAGSTVLVTKCIRN